MKTVRFAALMFAACTSQIAPASTTPDDADGADAYAAALHEAFARYEEAINAVRGDAFASEDEAETVSRSLSPAYFDGLLAVALARRGRSIDDLASYARANETFFNEQRALYAGRLERLDHDRLAIAAQVVTTEMIDESLVASAE